MRRPQDSAVPVCTVLVPRTRLLCQRRPEERQWLTPSDGPGAPGRRRLPPGKARLRRRLTPLAARSVALGLSAVPRVPSSALALGSLASSVPGTPGAKPGFVPSLQGESVADGQAEATRRVSLTGEAREVALAEAQTVLTMVMDGERRSRLADLVAAVGEGAVEGDEAEALEELLELGLQTGRLRAVYGPGGEQAALATYRRLPRGRELAASACEVSTALDSLVGAPLEGIAVQAVGPGSFLLSIATAGIELSVRLDRQGARLASVGV